MWELLLRDKEWWEQSDEREPDGVSTPEQAERVRILSGVLFLESEIPASWIQAFLMVEKILPLGSTSPFNQPSQLHGAGPSYNCMALPLWDGVSPFWGTAGSRYREK